MIYTVKDTDKILVDARNRHIKNVYEFNDETMEAKMYLMNGKNELVVVQDKAGPRTVGIEICLPGARIMDKQEYKEKYVIKQETKEIDDGTEDLFLVFNEFELLRVTGQQLKDADISYEQGKAMFKLLGGAIETALNIPLDDTDYFVFTESISNLAYAPDAPEVKILLKNGNTADISTVSEMFDHRFLSERVTKYYLCYPKECR